MLPASPAMAMIAADYLSRHVIRPKAFHRFTFKIPFLFSIGLYFILAIAAGIVILFYSSADPRPVGLLILPVLVTSGALIIFVMFLLKKNLQLVLAIAVFQIIVMGPLNGDVIAYLRGYPMHNISRDIHKYGEGEEWVGLYAPLYFFSRMEILTLHPVLRINGPGELQEFLHTDDRIFIVIREQDYSEEIRKFQLTVLETREHRKKNRTKLKQAWKMVREKGVEEGIGRTI